MKFSVHNGSFSYGATPVLAGISFSVSQGEVLAVLGSNGIGKTTLLKCMMGLLPWSSGYSAIDEVDTARSHDLWKRIGYVPQARDVTTSLTVYDMVLLGRSAHLGMFAQPGPKDREIAARAIDTVGIGHLKEKQSNRISGGELQMALIARALCCEPDMLVLDEPESNLDFKNQLVILQLIRNLAKEKGISAIINTHYPEHALKISDNALLLNHDRKTVYGPAQEVISEDNMRNAFHVDVKIQEYCFFGETYRTIIPLSVVSDSEETLHEKNAAALR